MDYFGEISRFLPLLAKDYFVSLAKSHDFYYI